MPFLRTSLVSFLGSFRRAAILIGCLFLLVLVIFMSRKTDRPQRLRSENVATIISIVGEADHRAPGALNFESLPSGWSVVSGELVAVHEASQVTLKFLGGTTVRLQPGSRLVAERDSTRAAGAVLATLLAGDADILEVGEAGSFRLMKSGHDISVTGSLKATAPDSVVVSGVRLFPAPARPLGGTGSVVITATTPIETPAPLLQPSSRMGDEHGEQVSADSLSNEEIRRALAAERGFFSRCYLTHLNRAKSADVTGSVNRSTTITLGFIISNSGKIRDAKIVRSDFNDAVLNNCVLESVERTPFRAFKGSDIPVLEFPIELK